MALQLRSNTITRPDGVTAVPNAEVYVYVPGGGPAAAIYVDSNGNTPLSQPMQTNSSGAYSYWVAPGEYEERISEPGYIPKIITIAVVDGLLGSTITVTKHDVGLGSVDDVKQMPLSYLDADSSFAANSDAKVPSQKAVRAALATKLDASAYNDRFKGVFNSLSALQTAYPSAAFGDYAQVDSGAGSALHIYSWDVQDGWVLTSADGMGAVNTDQLPEGTTNKYFTDARALAAAPAETLATVGALAAAASAKTLPVDADTFTLTDSQGANAWKKITWANIKSTMRSFLDPFYATSTQGTKADNSLQKDGSVAATGDLDMAGNQVKRPKLYDIREAVGTASFSAGTLSLDLATGNFFAHTLTANVTAVVIANYPPTGQVVKFTLELTQDGTGGRTVSGWPSGTKWSPSGSVPAITSAANGVDVLVGYTRDGGTTVRMSRAMLDSK